MRQCVGGAAELQQRQAELPSHFVVGGQRFQRLQAAGGRAATLCCLAFVEVFFRDLSNLRVGGLFSHLRKTTAKFGIDGIHKFE